jgi:hypothetical protein
MDKQELMEKYIKLMDCMISSKKGESGCGGDCKSGCEPENELIGEYVIVRCRDAGVHAGFLVKWDGREVTLKESRRLWYWKAGGGEHSLSGVARHGLSDGKIAGPVDLIVLPEACEIISTTSTARSSISEYQIYQAS